MVDSGHGRRRRHGGPVISPVLRPALWSALLGAVAAMAMATPAYADPALPNVVPDTGSRPVAAGGLRLPGAGSGLPGAPPTGAAGGFPGVLPGATTLPVGGLAADPLVARIDALEAENGRLGTELIELNQQLTDARTELATAQRELAAAETALVTAQARAEATATDAFKAGAALPPGELARDLQGLSVLQRLSRGEQAEAATTAATGELSRAKTARELAARTLTAVEERVGRLDTTVATAQRSLRDNETKLIGLRAENKARLIELERQRDAAEQRLGAGYVEGQSSTGLIASPQALAAVKYALAQLGDPYLWSAEGPDRFDCSGLMWAAYRSAGYYDLPRVSRDQYFATRGRTVDRAALLPGDLLFFASGSSWTTIHHVGMYLGGGKMVQAPRSGDVVKISTVRWSGLYAATRVVGAVPAPTTPAPAPTTPAPKPTPSPSKPPTKPPVKPTPRPTRPTLPPPSTPPTTPPTTPPASPTPTPTPPSPTPSVTPTPTASTSSSATPSPVVTSASPSTAASSATPQESSSASASASTAG
ncbi:C40 family peptidase [Micromonospora psammae]|uniref:C40 family peptidase n=1 Tax=Micromonospora sp. CPCC 205556 TaxID=3122398 RepID=UPI002FF051D5